MKLLIERNVTELFDCIIEETLLNESKVKQYWINGPFLQAEIKNHNRRMYPSKIMEREAARYVKEKIEDNQGVGELGHPDNPTINLDRVSHKIVMLTREGNNWIGRAKVIDTPLGKIVKNLMDEGIKFGVSSRGLGSLKEENGVNIVCEDFYLVTPADIVSDPSGPNCWVESVMEGREWAFAGDGKIYEKAKAEISNSVVKGKIDEMRLLVTFENIISEIARKK
jgi:hypothetical protein